MLNEVFSNAPLALTAFEVRYFEQPALTDAFALDRLKGALADRFPLRDDLEQQQIALMVGAPQPASFRARVVPRLTTRDRTTACQIGPTNLIVETTSYSGFEAFLELITAALQALELVVKPEGILRIGLRYIDEIRVPSVRTLPGDWQGYINEHLLAPVAKQFVKEAGVKPLTWQGFVQYGTGTDQHVVLRYGPGEGYAVPPDGPTRRKNAPKSGLFFLLDCDSYWETSGDIPEFDSHRLIDICRELHTPVKALFETVITPKLVNEVFRKPLPDGGIA